ncbi:hypothetical protein ACWEPM_33880 [Streptomyces sp. NPDC004244]
MRRSLVSVLTAVFAAALAVAGPASSASASVNGTAAAHAAVSCTTLTATVANSAGNPGGHVQATLCHGAAPYLWHLNESYNNFVEDYQADGVAARAYIASGGTANGPLGADDTSTSGGTRMDPWESTVSSTWVRVYVCLGTKRPLTTGARCASAFASA